MKHAQTIFGLEVIASSLRGGHPLFKIDVLAIDAANRPFIFECKLDLVDAGAIEQLVGYKQGLLAGWSSFEKRVSEVRGRRVTCPKREPVLVCIGYGYEDSSLGNAGGVECLTYTYHDVTLTNDVVHHRRPGRVSIQYADAKRPSSRHPVVSKRDAVDKRLEPFPPGAHEAFWSIHAKLIGLAGVGPPTWREKNLIEYKVGKTIFATVIMGFPSIQWNVTLPASRTVSVVSGSEQDEVHRVLLEAYSCTCNCMP